MNSKIFTLLAILLIISVGFSIYSNTFTAGFHLDGNWSIVENQKIRDLSNLRPLFTHHRTRFLTYLTFAVNYHFGRLNVFGYHAVNLTVHIFSSIVIYFLLLLILKTPGINDRDFGKYKNFIALFTSLIFLTHPLQTQGVTYIVQRATSLVAFFYISSIYLYIKARLERSLPLYILAFIATILAMFSKPNAFTLPVMLVVCEFMFFDSKTENLKTRLKCLSPYLLTLAIVPLLAMTAHFFEVYKFSGVKDITRQTDEISRWAYFLTQTNVIRTYIRLLFLPINQNVDYDYPISHSIFEFNTLVSVLFLVVIFWWAFTNLKKRRLISFGIFWFFLSICVESGLYPLIDVIFEHRVYLPMAGFAIFFTTAIFTFFKDKIKYTAFLCMIIAALSIMAFDRNKVWQNDLILWQDVVRKSPRKARPNYSVAFAYEKKGDYPNAIKYYSRALMADPNHTKTLNNFGIIHANKGNFGKAMKYLKRAVESDPEHARSIHNLGFLYAREGDHKKAIEYYQKAIKLESDNSDFYFNIARSFEYMGNYEKSIEYYKKAIRLKPDDREAYNRLEALFKKTSR